MLLIFAFAKAKGNRGIGGRRRASSVGEFAEDEIFVERHLRSHEDDRTSLRLFPQGPGRFQLHWSACIMHNDPDYHTRASTFDESMFEGSGPAAYSYAPFGCGPRMCLGLEFTRMELLTFLHNLVNGFCWSLVNPSEEIIYNPMPMPVEGFPIHLRPHD